MYLVVPGRHILNTKFQEDYILSVISNSNLIENHHIIGPLPTNKAITGIVLLITSSNLDTSKESPVSKELRIQTTSLFAHSLRTKSKLPVHIIPIPHYTKTSNFAQYLIKEVYEHTEGTISLTPRNSIIMCSTKSVYDLFIKENFSILPAESSNKTELSSYNYNIITPTKLLSEILSDKNWISNIYITKALHVSTLQVWKEHPWLFNQIKRLSTDPLLTLTGGLTTTRNYNSYALGMDNPNLLKHKYDQIKPFIKQGKIVDEGCSTGSLIQLLTEDFPDSDFLGVEITGEFYSRCNEALRAGIFGNAFVHFHQRNALQPIFKDNSINTTICNSTCHEYFSYNTNGEHALIHYLNLKLSQLVQGGRLIIRDVVGPDYTNLPNQVILRLNSSFAQGQFRKFMQDYCIPFAGIILSHNEIRLDLRYAFEFITKFNYTDNWNSEMKEQFGFWSFSDWQRNIPKGFNIHHKSNAYSNTWLQDNLWNNHVDIIDTNGQSILHKLDTHMLLILQKN